MRHLVTLACGLALSLGTGQLLAQTEAPPAADLTDDERKALELYQRGDASYASGDYAAAIEAFEAAFALSRRPLLLFSMANAHERAGALVAAKAALLRYRTVADTSEHATIDARIASLDVRIEDAIEDEKVVAESHRAELAAARREGGAQAAESCRAVPVPDAEPSRAYPLRPAAYALVGVGGTGLVAAAILGGLALSARSEARELCSGELCKTEAASALDRDRLLSVAADVAVGLGAAAVVSGALMLLLEDLGQDASTSPDLGFAAGPRYDGGAEAWMEVRF